MALYFCVFSCLVLHAVLGLVAPRMCTVDGDGAELLAERGFYGTEDMREGTKHLPRETRLKVEGSVGIGISADL
jgi:hypothetical protein